jgi:hypothetical protein
VRGLIVLVLVIEAGLGWIVREADVQRNAVAAVKKNGGSVAYSWNFRDGISIPRGKPWAPRWLVDLIGVDYFGHVTVVELFPGATDAAVVQVACLSRLEYVYLEGPSIRNARLAHLKGLTKLSVLCLKNTRVTYAGAKELNEALPTLTIYH